MPARKCRREIESWREFGETPLRNYPQKGTAMNPRVRPTKLNWLIPAMILAAATLVTQAPLLP